MITTVFYGQVNCKIDSYNTEDGLSNAIIRDIIKDKEGFMWFATWNGLDRFDGRNFISFKSSAGDQSALQNNRIELIKEDARGFIWLKAYDEQIYRFDKKTGTFVAVTKLLKDNNNIFENIIPTQDGNVWIISGNNGIYRSDTSLKITHFSDQVKTAQRISSNKINFVMSGKDNLIYLGTDKGLDKISKTNNGYKSSVLIAGHKIISYLDSADGKFWFGDNNGNLFSYEKLSQKIKTGRLINGAINSIVKSRNGKFLYATTASGELLSIDPDTLKLLSRRKISDKSIFKLFEDAKGNFWIEPNDNGVLMVDPKGEVHHYTQKVEVSIYQLRNSYGIFEDSFKRVWVKLKGGGFGYYDQSKKTIEYFFNKPGDPSQKFSNTVSTAFMDPAGIFWMSTSDGGLEKIILQNENFKQRLMVTNAENKLQNEIRALYADRTSRLWMASKAGELKIFRNGNEIKYSLSNFDIRKFGSIYTISEDSKGNIWLGSKGNGVFKLTPDSTKKDHFSVLQLTADKTNKISLSSDAVYSILTDSSAQIWIGTYGGGINLLKDQNGHRRIKNRFLEYPKGYEKVRYLAEGYNHEIWIGTTNGLAVYDSKQNRFHTYSKSSDDKNSLNSNDILFIFKDSKNQMWLGTAGGGLALAIRTKKGIEFKNFTKADGLSSEFILGITQDRHNNLWLSTENGISTLDINSKKIRNFDKYDGLLKTNFSEATVTKLPDGQLLFGTKNGYIALQPDKVVIKKTSVPLVFTNFEVNNESVRTYKVDSPLAEDVNYDNKIQLDHQQNTISIYYNVLDYRSANKQSFKYRLKGLDDRWYSARNQKRATYTNLPPGNYQFEVKCVSDDLYYNSPSKKLSFTILPPFWKTDVAYIIYTIIALVILEILRRTAKTIIKLRNDVIVEQKVTDLKLQFFTNMSHELRTPLTLIMNPIEEISKTEILSPKGNEYIDIAKKNTARLARFINQLLDFRKVQSGVEKLYLESVEIVDFVNSTVSLFSQVARESNIILETKFGNAQISASIDAEKTDIILYNLLSNAIKYTPKGGRILVDVRIENQNMMIHVIDNGKGVSEDQLDNIFKLYEGIKNKEVIGSGIGLALCRQYAEMHGGNIFANNNSFGGLTVTVCIPIKSNHQVKNKYVPEVSRPKKGYIADDYTSESELESKVVKIKKTVMLVDDNRELRSFLRLQFQTHYNTLEAENGFEALRILENTVPDMIVSDITMPVMDGTEFLRHVKENIETSHIPFILLTAKSNIENQIDGINLGADLYLTKPFNTAYLVASVENLLKSRQMLFERLPVKDSESPVDPQPSAITVKDKQFLDDVIAMVEKEYKNPDLSVDYLIKNVNVSRATFNRKFKSLTNMTAVEYIKVFRVKQGKLLFDQGERDVATVAYQIGFNNAGYFSTCFKEIYNITPSDYLKQVNSQ